MVATSWPTEEVSCASDLYAGVHCTLQDKSSTKAATSKHPNEDTSRSGQGSANANEAGPVRFVLVMVEPVTTAHVPLGAGNGQYISTLSREGPRNGARHFPFTSIVKLMAN